MTLFQTCSPHGIAATHQHGFPGLLQSHGAAWPVKLGSYLGRECPGIWWHILPEDFAQWDGHLSQFAKYSTSLQTWKNSFKVRATKRLACHSDPLLRPVQLKLCLLLVHQPVALLLELHHWLFGECSAWWVGILDLVSLHNDQSYFFTKLCGIFVPLRITWHHRGVEITLFWLPWLLVSRIRG